jgi:hypothetical protein
MMVIEFMDGHIHIDLKDFPKVIERCLSCILSWVIYI